MKDLTNIYLLILVIVVVSLMTYAIKIDLDESTQEVPMYIHPESGAELPPYFTQKMASSSEELI